MNTKYGHIDDKLIKNYVERLKNKIFKALPLKEENCQTLDSYLEALIRELIGNELLIKQSNYNGQIISVISILESLIYQEDLANYKSDIFSAMKILENIRNTILESRDGT